MANKLSIVNTDRSEKLNNAGFLEIYSSQGRIIKRSLNNSGSMSWNIINEVKILVSEPDKNFK